MQKSSLLKNQFSKKLIHSYLPAESDKHKGGAGGGNLRGVAGYSTWYLIPRFTF